MFGEEAGAERAASFAAAAVIACLHMSDWQISQDVEEAMRSAVDALPGPCVRVAVAIHDGWIDLLAADGHVVTERRCFPRREFGSKISCDQAETSTSLSPGEASVPDFDSGGYRSAAAVKAQMLVRNVFGSS